MLYNLVNGAFWVLEMLILVRVILSWVPHNPHTSPLDMLYAITNPLINTCREILYSIYRLLGIDGQRMPLDFSPILAFLFLHLLRGGVLRLMYMIMT